MAYRDVREFIERVDAIGELTRLEGVNWNEEAGAVFYLSSDAVLMSKFPGYPPGYRILANQLRGSVQRFLLAANWSTNEEGVGLTKAWKERLRAFEPVPPKWVDDGPIMENVHTGSAIDMLEFPVPKWHEEDGGRYIGTEGIEIVKDPESGRLNFGTYRMQVHDKATLGIYMSEGKDGYIIREKYARQGKLCPVVAVFGVDPGLLLASGSHITHVGGTSEFDYAGWLKGMPEEVIQGRFTGLPIPANAEIAIEGEILPGDMAVEGPFGEQTGYSEARELPAVRVKALYHRDDPIITGRMPLSYPPGKRELQQDFYNAALIWDQMEKAGVREIKGVACYYHHRLIVVSIRNSFAGHSRQAGIIASQCHAGNYLGNWVIVVDEDIDPSNIKDVLWAVLTRTDAKRAIQVLEDCWSSHMSLIDPSRPFIKAEYPLIPSKATYRSAAVIDACWPVEWDRSWHRGVKPSQELQDRVMEKWGNAIFRKGAKTKVWLKG
ncbi:MAG: UbiD family decarboxylase [Chloroflexi bacterium]|nr:UbiD family decarboxylase [Chloroflexota bacterium]